MNKIISFSVCFFLLLRVAAQQKSVTYFPLSAVRLQDSPFKEAQQTDLNYMLALDADRLMAPYRKEAGLPPKAENYGNWENTGLDGHIGGHYVSALANMYAATGNAAIKTKLDYVIAELATCQAASGNGYISGVPGGKKIWAEIAAGNIDAGGFSLNGKWVPLYNIHKIFAGLYDAWTIADNAKAGEVLLLLCDWFYGIISPLKDAQIQDMLRSEHGGLNEVFALVARKTGEQRYLEFAKRLSDQRILQPLLENRDALTGLHANTQIPKVVGYQAIASASGDTTWNKAADFFWNTVVHHRSVSIGGNSVREHFHSATNFSSMMESREGPETCNSYNMLRLTKGLFSRQPSVDYLDYYERTLYNHILSSQHPDGGFVYFTPMRPGHYRVYSTAQQGFWCCVGSGLENHGKYGELIYAHRGSDLMVNLFIPSTLVWKEAGLELVQETAFPQEGSSRLKLKMKKSRVFSLQIRKPGWLAGELQLKVNGKPVVVKDTEEGYIAVRRRWKNGDQLEWQLPMKAKSELLPDGSNWVSYLYGPVVLAAAMDTVGLQGLFADGSRMGHIAAGPLESLEDAPMVVSQQGELASGLVPLGTLRFRLSQLVQERYQQLELQPFYQLHNRRYAVYFPFTAPEKLDSIQAAIKSREAAALAFEKRTIDQVNAGEQQPESDHGFRGEGTESGLHRERLYRRASGWFSYELKNSKDALVLRVRYSAGEKNRSFRIYLNETELAAVSGEPENARDWYEQEYSIPASLLEHSGKLTVKFVAEEGKTTGRIMGVWLLK